MKCENFEKQIFLSDIDNLNAEKQLALKEHLELCSDCKTKGIAMGDYHSLIANFRDTHFKINKPDEFTNDILSALDASTDNYSLKEIYRINHNILLRIAAILVVFLNIGGYAYQKTNINSSTAQLEANYTDNTKNSEFFRDYSDCRSSSETILTGIFLNNNDLTDNVNLETVQLSPAFIKKQTSGLCSHKANEFINASADEQKLIITRLLNSLN